MDGHGSLSAFSVDELVFNYVFFAIFTKFDALPFFAENDVGPGVEFMFDLLNVIVGQQFNINVFPALSLTSSIK